MRTLRVVSFKIEWLDDLLDFCFVDKGNEEDFETNWELEVNKFDDMGLKDHVLRGIYGYGFVEPSPIQQKGVLPVI